MLKTEFQAVIFAAGKGSRMPEITAGTPKCLLPIGNKPMVWYPLQMLENAGFRDVILIVSETEKNEVQLSLDKVDLNIKIDYFCISPGDDLGTADSLRMLDDKIFTDVVCVSCDLITDFDLHEAFNVFRKHDASIVSCFFNPQFFDISVVPGPKAKHKPERDLIGLDSQTNRLVFLASASDFEEDLTLKKSLLRKHTNITMHSNLMDAHLYILKHWVYKYLQHEKQFSTLKGEFLPGIIKKQLSKPTTIENPVASVVNTEFKNDIFKFAGETDLDKIIREANAYNDHTGDLKGSYHADPIRCFGYVADKSVFAIRINTIPLYWNICSRIVDVWDKVTFNKKLTVRDEKSEISSNQVDDRTVVCEGAKLCEKTSFKASNIGGNCEVQSKTRVFNSVLMNNVVIKERCAIENCIICDNVVIEAGSQLKDCIVGSGHVVGENSEFAKEILTDSDRLMEF